MLLFEAPTGYGKTGCVLEFALGQLRSGRFARLIWLTSKATGQLQVMRTLAAMTGRAVPEPSLSDLPPHVPGDPPGKRQLIVDTAPTPVAAWQMRPKSEHCVNSTFHCVREVCGFLDGCATRWPQSGLARFYLDDAHPRDLETLRAAGRDARICPYEITRAALPFNDVWVGDYNYVFAPDNRGLFSEQPGFDPAETLLVIDEAHNLPARVADAFSHTAAADDARAVLEELRRLRPLASLLLAWEHWTQLLAHLPSTARLDPAQEADVLEALDHLAPQIATTPLDYAALGPHLGELLWQPSALLDFLQNTALEKLLHCPRPGELHFTCLDAAPAIGETLRAYGGVILMSATLSPAEAVATACGLDEVGRVVHDEPSAPRLTETVRPTAPERLGDLNKRETKKLYRQLTNAADLLRVEEERDSAQPRFLRAPAPWRDAAYDVAVDLRVDTTFRHRGSYYATTAATVVALRTAAGGSELARDHPTSAVAVFFPSYAYAEAVQRALANLGAARRVALQPRLPDLAAQTAWVEASLAVADALFLVLGSSFAEGIDLLGGRVTHAMVVGPALPEVNAVQKARLAACARAGLSRDGAFRRVYQIPGMTKVNQALGRLVRAPGQRARVLLHCRRFAEPSYAALLAPEYRQGHEIATDAGLADWLKQGA